MSFLYKRDWQYLFGICYYLMSLKVPIFGTSRDNQRTSSDIRELQIPIRYCQWRYRISSSKALLSRWGRNTVYTLTFGISKGQSVHFVSKLETKSRLMYVTCDEYTSCCTPTGMILIFGRLMSNAE